MRNRTQDDYYAESRRLRAVVMDMAKELEFEAKKKLRFNKSLANSNGALVLSGARSLVY